MANGVLERPAAKIASAVLLVKNEMGWEAARFKTIGRPKMYKIPGNRLQSKQNLDSNIKRLPSWRYVDEYEGWEMIVRAPFSHKTGMSVIPHRQRDFSLAK